jgi:predicted histidine transporter YuiF (NhaC family)
VKWFAMHAFNRKILASFCMLFVGFFVSLRRGSSFLQL